MTLYTITDQTLQQVCDHARAIARTRSLELASGLGARIVEILDNEAKQIDVTIPGMTELAQRVVGKHPALAEGYTAKTPTDLLVDAYRALLSLPPAHGWRLGNQHVLVALRDAIAKYTGREPQQVQDEMEAETIDMRTSMVAVFGDALPKCTIPKKLADNVSASYDPAQEQRHVSDNGLAKAPSDPLVAGKFSRGMMTGGVDYGFTFRRASNPEHDFYVTIGHIAEGCDLVQAVKACIERGESYQWVADAIVKAYNEREAS